MNNPKTAEVLPVLIVTGLLMFAVGFGCSPANSNDPLDAQIAGAPADQAPLAASRITAIPDLPVPASMKILKGLSSSYEGAGSRMVNYTYEGWVDILRVHRFYRDQMPVSNWHLLADNFDRGVYKMTFSKGSEICTVTIKKHLLQTRVQLLIQEPRTMN